MKTSLVYVTASGIDEARRIARALVESRLAACANIVPSIESVYHWKGSVESGAESVVLLKTRASLVPKLTEAVRAMHSYECPCVVALPMSGGNPDFLKWIAVETRPPRASATPDVGRGSTTGDFPSRSSRSRTRRTAVNRSSCVG